MRLMYIKKNNCISPFLNIAIILSLCSPHLLTIRERISVGNDGGPVPVRLLSDLFDEAKKAIDEAIESENGSLTHFEVV
jgi:folylpolyglutamate synthase/dihydropteroate synthase